MHALENATALYPGVAGSGPFEKEQKFVPFSFYNNPLPPITMLHHIEWEILGSCPHIPSIELKHCLLILEDANPTWICL